MMKPPVSFPRQATVRLVLYVLMYALRAGCSTAWVPPSVSSSAPACRSYECRRQAPMSRSSSSQRRRLVRVPSTTSCTNNEELPDLVEDRVSMLLEILMMTDLPGSFDQTDLIRPLVLSLDENTTAVDQDDLFPPILGNYDVEHVLPNKPNDKPVGGKWSRGPAQVILRTHRTLQHLLPPKAPDSVAQAVNVIVLSAFLDFVRIQVILRGDAYALSPQEREDIVGERQTPGGLSPRAVRADFDPPRIALGVGRRQQSFSKRKMKFNLRLGPTSSVVLDTPYCDKAVRIGKGSKGSYFVFTPCSDDEADEWQAAIDQRPARKSRILATLAVMVGVGMKGVLSRGLAWRLGGGVLSAVSIVSGCAVALSTGGIEED